MAERLLTTKDCHNIINYMVADITGQTSTTRVTDTSSFVSAGETLLTYATENVLNSLALLIGRVLIASRPYSGKFDIIKSISSGVFSNRLEKISYYADSAMPAGAFNTDLYTNLAEGFTAGQNPDENGDPQSVKSQYEQHRLTPLTMFFGGRNAWLYGITIDDVAYKDAFRNEQMFNEFISGMLREHRNNIESGLEAYRRMTFLNYIAGIYDMSAKMPGSVIDLVAEFNSKNSTTYTRDELLTVYQDDFYAFFVEEVKLISKRLEHRSVRYHWTPTKQDAAGNYLKLMRHTPRSRQKMALYSPFMVSAEATVFPKIFNDQYLSVDNYEAVDFWQFEDAALSASINVTPAIPDDLGGQVKGDAVVLPYVLGAIWDEDACLVDVMLDRAVTSPLEAKKLYYSTWFHYLRGSINDFTENGVLLILGEGGPVT